jgi:hypothetical protein
MKVAKAKGQEYISGVTSDQISLALAHHHSKDLYVPECKNGPTYSSHDILRLDAWVLARTYSPMTTLGYEIKVSRADFEQDQKWTAYLDYCHRFFFACPAGLIRSTDLPKEVGLVWYSAAGNIHIKRHADRHEPDPVKFQKLLIYVLMSRSVIVGDMYAANNGIKSREEYIKDYLAEAEKRGILAACVRGHVRDMQDKIKKREDLVQSQERSIKDFTVQLARLGITWNSESKDWNEERRVGDQIDHLRKCVDLGTINLLKYTGENMIRVAEEVGKYYMEGGDHGNSSSKPASP